MQRRVFLGLAAGGQAFWASSGAAVSPARAVIRLSCPDTDPGKALCQVMTQSLSEAVPGAVIRRVPQGDEAVTGPLDMGVAVHITAADAQGIGAQMTWLAGPQGPRQTGKEIRVDVVDTGLDQATLHYLANALLEQDNCLQSRLDAMGAS